MKKLLRQIYRMLRGVPCRALGRAWRLVPTPDGRGYVIFNAAISASTAVVTTWGLSIYQNHEFRQEKKIETFRTEAETLGPVVANYVHHILVDGHPNEEATQRLLENIIRQVELLKDAEGALTPDDMLLAERYKADLLSFRAVISASNSVLNMKDFWEKASKASVSRNELLRRMPS